MIQVTAPSHPISGLIHLSGSKSLSNRYLILSQLLDGAPPLKNLSPSKDTEVLKQALLLIRQAGNPASPQTIDVGDAGTDMRFLTALLALQPGQWFLTGSERMKERPIAPLVQALRQLGANIRYAGKEGYPPLVIEGKRLEGGRVEVPANISSQFISALLLIAPLLQQGIQIQWHGPVVSKPYIHMTLAVLRDLNLNCSLKTDSLVLAPGSKPSWTKEEILIESDWSSASYWYSICALCKHAKIRLQHLFQSSTQGDAVLPALFASLGVKTRFTEQGLELESFTQRTSRFEYDFTDCPDLAQTVAVVCYAKGIEAHLRGLSTLRIKETDRIHALETELSKLGATVKSGADELFITGGNPPQHTTPALIHTYKDHRMAMSFAPLSLVLTAVQIDDPEVVVKSYPSFWEDLKTMGFNVNLQP